MTRPQTLSEKIWDRHTVARGGDGEPDLLYIDLHLVHEVTSPQAFDGLRISGRGVRRPDLTVATEDHNVPTADIDKPIADAVSRTQVETLRRNADEFGITNYPMGHAKQGIVHVIGPEQGLTQPGMTIVCGDSHTSTHGAFGAIAFGIGTSEVEHVLATQTLPQMRPGTMAVTVEGTLAEGSTAKDVILAIIGRIGTTGGVGRIIEYRGPVIEALSMEGRMTVCNMSIEAGAKAGLIAPDETTFAYLRGREQAPAGDLWEEALADWRTLRTDDAASFDVEVTLDGAAIPPMVTWGTNPAQSVPLQGAVPAPDSFDEPARREAAARALDYMGLASGTPMRDIAVDTVFIGSCTNSRIEDLRAAASVVGGRRVADGVRTLVVPGSGQVKAQAEAEGLPEVFRAAGFDWREPGCSMCLAMNPDKLAPGERSASTSNRNFEGRQGRGGRTHLCSRPPPLPVASPPPGICDADDPGIHSPVAAVKATRVVSGTAVPLDRSDVDTDQIIPSDWLKQVSRTGFEKGLFSEWRDSRDFVLNDERYAGATILLAGTNFGTGSSREHAVWAIQQYGFDAVISPRFADIFRNNCTKNGLVPAQIGADAAAELMAAVQADPGLEITVDVERLTVEAPAIGFEAAFSLEASTQQRFLEGLDDIGLTLRHTGAIDDYERRRLPWLPAAS